MFIPESEVYTDEFYQIHGHFGTATHCPYCSTPLHTFLGETQNRELEPIDHFVKLCARCQWWRYMMRVWDKMDEFETIPLLSKRAVAADDAPIAEITHHLLRHWGDRKLISPRQCEELVADVFKGVLNCEVHYLTNSVYAKDGGIDFVLLNDNIGIVYAFQVKRRMTDRKECVKCIREFIGALAQSPYRHGYLVTTADTFTRDAYSETTASVDTLKKRNLEVSMIDGRQLYALIKRGRVGTPLEHQLTAIVRGVDHKVGAWQLTRLGTKAQNRLFRSEELLAECGVQPGT